MVPFPHAALRGAPRVLVVLGLAFAVACGGGGDSTPPGPAPVATVAVAAIPTTIYVGATIQLAVTTRDAGGATLAGRTVTYSSNNNAIASVSSGGAITANGVGSAIIHVTSEAKSADVTVTVALVPVVSVVVTPPSATVGVGATTQLTATPRDSVNGPLTGRTAAWTSSAPAVATVNATSGLVTGVANGSATIRATIEGKFAESVITVGTVVAPSISGVAPALLTSGITATITGTNFGADVAGNTVSVDDVPATVLTASPTQLTITVPTLPCLPAHSARIQVVAQGTGGTTLHPVRAGTPIAVTTGTQVLLSNADASCAELPAGAGTYVVSVVNTTKGPGLDQTGTSVGFRLSGALPPASLAEAITTPSVLRQSSPAARSVGGASLLLGGAAGVDAATATSERMHEIILESNRLAYQRLHAAGAARGAASRSLIPTAHRAVALPALNETRKFRVAQFSTAVNATGSCNNYVEITARAVYVGTRSVIYEDVAAPLAGTVDSYLKGIGTEFDNAMYVVDSTYFGDPLVTDSETDADKHLNMVFTPSITTGVAGFVTSCDFFTRDATNDQQSNLGEYFYAIVPTVAGTGFSGNTADNWLRTMRHTIVHEVKHIASFGARLVNNASTFEESWLEEGTARHSEEIWERNYVYNVAWKGNSAYHETLYCDVRPTFAECTGKPFAMFNHFSTLYGVLDNPGNSSMFGRVADGDFNFYAASWSLVRYAIDRYATSEQAFLRGLTQSTTTAGLASLSAQSGGRSSVELLTNWSLAMYLDDTVANPDLSFPTWNTHDIYAGMNNDFKTTSFPKAFPLIPATVNTAFTADNTGIKGGGFAMYRVPSNSAGTSTLSLRAQGGTAPASTALRVAIVRVP